MKAKALQLKVTLKNSKPLIWRRIIVPADYSFFDLHVAIQDVMNWSGYHLHQFFNGIPYSKNSIVIGWPTDEMDFDADERKVRIGKYLKKEKDYVFYEYDFGDSWEHKVELEKFVDMDDQLKYPQVVGGKNASPLEDCGGIFGYRNLIDVMGDVNHKEYKEMVERFDFIDQNDFDPSYFAMEEIKFRDTKEVLKEYKDYLDLGF